jgi:NADPH:quinone reductase-like Zn-dependent oxidoreductase
MKAVVRDRFGSPEVLELLELEAPELADDEVLVRVHASSVNAVDWYTMAGRPLVGRALMGLRAPKVRTLGGDFAGTVEAVGKVVTVFEPGDEVFGVKHGAFAEYVFVPTHLGIARKPANLTFEESAAVPIAALAALQGLRDHGKVQPGQKVLVNGASGGVGTFAVQIAKALGARVTAVCSTRNVEQARSLGADDVIDYTREDFTRNGRRYDVLFDNSGSRSWSACRRVLAPDATVVLVGGPKTSRLLGPLGHFVAMKLGAVRSSQNAIFFVAKPNRPDLDALRDLIEAGTIAPVIERRYELRDVADALRYIGEGHARGKLVVTV